MYYDVEDVPQRVVIVKAVVEKDRNRVLIGGKEIRKVELVEATSPLSEYAKKAGKETVVVTRRGRPLAAASPSTPRTGRTSW